MSHEERSTQSYGSNLKGSFGRSLAGGLLILVSVALLFKNEGKAINTAKMLSEGAGAAISIDPTEINPTNDGKLVILSGKTQGSKELLDTEFGLKQSGLKLVRTVSMYQWSETSSSKKETKLGGSTETVISYDYKPVWSTDSINSSNFKQAAGHANPALWKFRNSEFRASPIRVGAFELSDELSSQVENLTHYSLTESDFRTLYNDTQSQFKIFQGNLVNSQDPTHPQVGDLRVEYQLAAEAVYTIVGKQTGSKIDVFNTKNGLNLAIAKTGTLTKEAFFKAAQSDNSTMTWITRVLGFALMWIGFVMGFGLWATLASALPFLGSIARVGGVIAGFLLSAMISLLTIAVGWFFYRPILSIVLISGAIGVGFFLKRSQASAPSQSISENSQKAA